MSVQGITPDQMNMISGQFRKNLFKNGIGAFQSQLSNLQETQVRNAKKDYLYMGSVVEDTDNNSDLNQETRRGQSNIMKSLMALDKSDNLLMNLANDYQQNIWNQSNANNPDDLMIINAILGGMAQEGITEDGKKIWTIGEGDDAQTFTKDQLAAMMEDVKVPAQRQSNDLMLAAQNIAKNVKNGMVDEDAIANAIYTAMNIPTDPNDKDPERIIDQKRSFVRDSLGGKPSLEDWLKSKQGLGMLSEFYPGATDINIDDVLGQMENEFDHGSSDMFDRIANPFLRDQYFGGVDQAAQGQQVEVPGMGMFDEEDISQYGTLTWDKGYEQWQADGNEGTIEDFKKQVNDWWNSPAGQKYAKENGFTHRIKAEGEEGGLVDIENDADVIAMTGKNPWRIPMKRRKKTQVPSNIFPGEMKIIENPK